MTECSPGSHPHTDQPNWRPAEAIGEYLQISSDARTVAKLFAHFGAKGRNLPQPPTHGRSLAEMPLEYCGWA
jgi:hypothetical protein